MLIGFLNHLRRAQIPASLRELLDLHQALAADLIFADIEAFYYLARTITVKDEAHYDRYDRAFACFFKDINNIDDLLESLIPDEWMRKTFERQLSAEEREKIQSLGGLEKLIEEFKKRLEEQKKRHSGGNRWIGTGGTSAFGHGGYHPEGMRIGGESRNRRALKVWQQRQYRNLDDSRTLGTRNIKVALRRLRQFARNGAHQELDLDGTIRATARNAGMLDIHMIPERHNAVKVLLFFDVGGSMDPYISLVEELFSAARSEFKHLEFFYFHNFIYESLWRDNRRRRDTSLPTQDLLNTYSRDYKIIFVGDAAMSPYEIAAPGGSVEHWNEEPGALWMKRLRNTFSRLVWLNPESTDYWAHTHSNKMIRDLIDDHMYPMSIAGLDAAMDYLRQGK